jgi:hypothetical protein
MFKVLVLTGLLVEPKAKLEDLYFLPQACQCCFQLAYIDACIAAESAEITRVTCSLCKQQYYEDRVSRWRQLRLSWYWLKEAWNKEEQVGIRLDMLQNIMDRYGPEFYYSGTIPLRID